MKKERREESFLKKPWFKGGQKAMNDFITNNLTYPKKAIEAKVEGTVNLRLDINYIGEVADAKVLSGIGGGCDEEALRIVKLLKFEVAKTPRKLKVTFHKNINIHFKLPKIQPKLNESKDLNKSQTITYSYVTTSKKVVEPDTQPKRSNSVIYTIQVK